MEFSSELPVFPFPKMKWTSNWLISPSIHIQLTAMGMNEMTASSKLPNDSHRKKKTIHPPLSLNLPQRLFGKLGVRCSKFCKKLASSMMSRWLEINTYCSPGMMCSSPVTMNSDIVFFMISVSWDVSCFHPLPY